MLEEVFGIPAHPLLIHAAVVFVPLLAALAIGYAAVPFVRPHIRWALGLLALATPVAALLAKLSGDAFFKRLQTKGRVTPAFLPKLEAHRHFGTLTVFAALALAVLTLALVYFIAPASADSPSVLSPVLSMVLRLAVVVAALVALYYVIRTGDSGAKAVWTGS